MASFVIAETASTEPPFEFLHTDFEVAMFSAQTYQQRRAALRARLRDGVVLLLGNFDSPVNCSDNVYPFRQDSSFLYFFGHNHPGLAGLIDLESDLDVFFGDEVSLEEVIWTGPQPSLAHRAEQAGVGKAHPLGDLPSVIDRAIRQGRTVHYLRPYRAEVIWRLAALLNQPIAGIQAGYSVPLTDAVVAMRECKSEAEIAEIEAALDITARMHAAAMSAARPGSVEREVVGVMEGVMRQQDLQLAYPVIFSKRGEVLHNHNHDLTLASGDLVVNDTGCTSALGYASDITRTLPIGGRFIGIKHALYELVLEAQRRAIASLRPGVAFLDVHKIACRVMVDGLKGLGCFRGDTDEIVESGAYAVFFQCGVGHQLGLDVHDMEALGEDHVGYDGSVGRSRLFGLRSLRLAKRVKEGFVVTIEPGIYIIPALLDRWRSERVHSGLINYDVFDTLRGVGGIRIEDDVVVTQTGSRVLGPHIPRTPQELQAAMHS